MANTHTTLTSLFTAIADAIRSKTGGTDAIVADQFPTAIGGIDTQENLDAEMATQDSLISRITAALEGKTVPSTEVGTFTCSQVTYNTNLLSIPFIVGMTWGEFLASPLNAVRAYGEGIIMMAQFEEIQGGVSIRATSGIPTFISVDGTESGKVIVSDKVKNNFDYFTYVGDNPGGFPL